MSLLLKRQEVSDRLWLKPHTIRVWIPAGKLKATRSASNDWYQKKRLTG